ncbi:MAG: hypothetical protein R2851_27985 [Caldilineaceae bacterium]
MKSGTGHDPAAGRTVRGQAGRTCASAAPPTAALRSRTWTSSSTPRPSRATRTSAPSRDVTAKHGYYYGGVKLGSFYQFDLMLRGGPGHGGDLPGRVADSVGQPGLPGLHAHDA